MKPMRYVFSTADTVRYRFPTHTNELVLDRADADAAEAFLVVLEPGEAPPLHVHFDTEQIFYIQQGHGTLEVGSEPPQYLAVGVGDLVRIPADTPHRIRCEGDVPLIYLSVDCFVHGRPAAEPTWDSHVRSICSANGWDYDAVCQSRRKK